MPDKNNGCKEWFCYFLRKRIQCENSLTKKKINLKFSISYIYLQDDKKIRLAMDRDISNNM